MALTKVNSILVDGAINTTAAGNVGIGTASPTNKLEVNGIVKLTPITYSSTPSSSYGGFLQGVNDGSLHVDSYNPTGNSFLAFGTNASSAAIVERMRITSAGDLLVATTGQQISGNEKVSIRGTTTVMGFSGNTSMFIATTGTGTETYLQFAVSSGGANTGSISTNGSITLYNTNSDYRLKENIAPMTGALAKVSALKPVTYKWKATGQESQGFIAHELQAVVPDCVTGKKDAVETIDDLDAEGKVIGKKIVPKYQGMDVSYLVATLTAAIQEQQAIITDLTTRLEALEAK
jgi:hypothetical protein